MDIQETDPRLIEDLIHHYSEKKRLSLKNFRYCNSTAEDKLFKNAATLCKQYELDAGSYVQMMYDMMGDKREFFAPMHLQGPKAIHLLENRKKEPSTYVVEITNATIKPEDIWNQQKSLAMIYIRNGEDSGAVLMNSSLKFFAWFRILSTPDRYEPVIAKYKHIAREELTSEIIDFAKRRGMDIDRILG